MIHELVPPIRFILMVLQAIPESSHLVINILRLDKGCLQGEWESISKTFIPGSNIETFKNRVWVIPIRSLDNVSARDRSVLKSVKPVAEEPYPFLGITIS